MFRSLFVAIFREFLFSKNKYYKDNPANAQL